jgi:hypothetical protein
MSEQKHSGSVDAIEKVRLAIKDVQEQKKRLDVLALKLMKGTLYTMVKELRRISQDQLEYDKDGSLRVAYIGDILWHALECLIMTIDEMQKGDSNGSGER